jgi:hypothetical protein
MLNVRHAKILRGRSSFLCLEYTFRKPGRPKKRAV